jgi:hypothetical protein
VAAPAGQTDPSRATTHSEAAPATRNPSLDMPASSLSAIFLLSSSSVWMSGELLCQRRGGNPSPSLTLSTCFWRRRSSTRVAVDGSSILAGKKDKEEGKERQGCSIDIIMSPKISMSERRKEGSDFGCSG